MKNALATAESRAESARSTDKMTQDLRVLSEKLESKLFESSLTEHSAVFTREYLINIISPLVQTNVDLTNLTQLCKVEACAKRIVYRSITDFQRIQTSKIFDSADINSLKNICVQAKLAGNVLAIV